MAIVIGAFKATKQGGWEGRIHSLTIDRKVRLVPNDDRVGDSAPAFRLMLGWQRIGDAWEERSRDEKPRHYLRVRFEDPAFPHPRQAALFPDEGGTSASLLWDRGFQ